MLARIDVGTADDAAELAAPEGTDPVVGVDALGQQVYRDEDGTDYVLVDAA